MVRAYSRKKGHACGITKNMQESSVKGHQIQGHNITNY